MYYAGAGLSQPVWDELQSWPSSFLRRTHPDVYGSRLHRNGPRGHVSLLGRGISRRTRRFALAPPGVELKLVKAGQKRPKRACDQSQHHSWILAPA